MHECCGVRTAVLHASNSNICRRSVIFYLASKAMSLICNVLAIGTAIASCGWQPPLRNSDHTSECEESCQGEPCRQARVRALP
jgi:hypothetical protein